ncbi:hypothetical protein F5877DRAFT_86320 [Lentinula edodes]|nr:hypothetical protein F5877DRAFT_86320 [Lentinula edodes]
MACGTFIPILILIPILLILIHRLLRRRHFRLSILTWVNHSTYSNYPTHPNSRIRCRSSHPILNPALNVVEPRNSNGHQHPCQRDPQNPIRGVQDGEAPIPGTSPPSSPPLPASESTTQPTAIPPPPTPQPAPAPQDSRFTNTSRPQTPVVGNNTASPMIGNLPGRRCTESSSSVSLLAGGGSLAGEPDDVTNANSLDNLRQDIEALETQTSSFAISFLPLLYLGKQPGRN